MAVFRVDAIGAALKELEISGYLVCRQLRDARGRITDTDYTIYEQPHTWIRYNKLRKLKRA